MNWIECKNKKPPKDEEIIILTDFGCAFVMYDSLDLVWKVPFSININSFLFSEGIDTYKGFKITHWSKIELP